MSTSRAYLAKRLRAIGRDDLVAAAERGEVSLHAAALWAGLITQQYVSEGNGSQNASKRAAWALLRAERATVPKPQPVPEIRSPPTPPKFSQDTRDIIERLVSLGRADLITLVVERRISPEAAGRIARRATARAGVTRANLDPSAHRPVVSETAQKPPVHTQKTAAEKAKPTPPRLDPRALIA
jgi:hypothetical protein